MRARRRARQSQAKEAGDPSQTIAEALRGLRLRYFMVMGALIVPATVFIMAAHYANARFSNATSMAVLVAEASETAERWRGAGVGTAAHAQDPRRLGAEGKETVSAVELSWRSSLGGADLLAQEGESAIHEANPIGKGWSLNLRKAPDGAELELAQVENPSAPFHPDRPPPDPIGFGPLQRS